MRKRIKDGKLQYQGKGYKYCNFHYSYFLISLDILLTIYFSYFSSFSFSFPLLLSHFLCPFFFSPSFFTRSALPLSLSFLLILLLLFPNVMFIPPSSYRHYYQLLILHTFSSSPLPVSLLFCFIPIISFRFSSCFYLTILRLLLDIFR